MASDISADLTLLGDRLTLTNSEKLYKSYFCVFEQSYWNESRFLPFWNVNAQWFAKHLWRNRIIKNQVSPCRSQWWEGHNFRGGKRNIFPTLAISIHSLSGEQAFVWKGHVAFTVRSHLLTGECHQFPLNLGMIFFHTRQNIWGRWKDGCHDANFCLDDVGKIVSYILLQCSFSLSKHWAKVVVNWS